MRITGINYQITIRYYLDGGSWFGLCTLCNKTVIWFQDIRKPIKLGWDYWETSTLINMNKEH